VQDWVIFCVVVLGIALVPPGRTLSHWFLAVATPLQNLSLLSVKCGLELSFKHSFIFVPSCELRLSIAPSAETPSGTLIRHPMSRTDTADQYIASQTSNTDPAHLRHRHDFALHAAGARIIDYLTSSTYQPKRGSHFWEWINGHDGHSAETKPPTVVLENDIRIGNCWSFAGPVGNIGISLDKRILITNITIDYVDPLVSPSNLHQAPKSAVMWGLLDNGLSLPDAMSKALKESDQTLCTAKCFSHSTHASSTQFRMFYPLANFTYDINTGNVHQSFPIHDAVHDSGVDFQVVVIQITDNWGADTTCLYHVGIHGKPVLD
jgi:hypothetical protein